MVDTSKSKYLHLTPPDFVILLEKLKFLEGYPPELRRRMSNAVESTFDAGIHGANKAHFQMFPVWLWFNAASFWITKHSTLTSQKLRKALMDFFRLKMRALRYLILAIAPSTTTLHF